MEVLNRAIESILHSRDRDEWEPIVIHVSDTMMSLWKGEVRRAQGLLYTALAGHGPLALHSLVPYSFRGQCALYTHLYLVLAADTRWYSRPQVLALLYELNFFKIVN